MIVGSLLLILVAVALLVLGLADGSSVLLIGSIAASLLAAVALVVGARQAATARGGIGGLAGGSDPRLDDEGAGHQPYRWADAGPGEPWEPALAEPADAAVPKQQTPGRSAGDTGSRRQPATESPTAVDAEPPADEPAPQRVPDADAARVAQMDADVFVVDGRPRYHVPDCPHLRGRESEALPVREAVELGFTPCGSCEPDSALLADARHG